jgi:hypothetical protein
MRMGENELGRLLEDDDLVVRNEEAVWEAVAKWRRAGEGQGMKGGEMKTAARACMRTSRRAFVRMCSSIEPQAVADAPIGQAVTTDAGWKDAEVYVVVERRSGGVVESGRVTGMDFEAREVTVEFPLPEAVVWGEVAAVRLVSNAKYVGLVNVPIEEENVRAEGDPFRDWTRQWHGRIFSFDLRGPRGAGFVSACVAASAGVLLTLLALSGLLCGGGRRRPVVAAEAGAAEEGTS